MIKGSYIVFREALLKALGYCIFWNSDLRQRFRSKVFLNILCAENFIYTSILEVVPRSQGERLVERRVSIFGIPVFVRRWQRKKYRVALLVDEFFGGWGTAIGGYGALARRYICRYIPNDEIQIDLLLDCSSGTEIQQKLVNQTMIYRLPSHPLERQRWLDAQGYVLFLSIEMTQPSFDIIKNFQTNIPLLFWIQDPRDLRMYQPRVQTVKRLREGDWDYVKDVSLWLQSLMRQKRVSFISQGRSLSGFARKMHPIPDNVPIGDVPNPVEIEFDYQLEDPPKENKIIFLGRLESVKRVWIVCEIAKAMPQYEFYILGATGKGRDEAANARTLESYRNCDGSANIANLHFTGHVDGSDKNNHIKTAKLMLNTSIWEAIPVSWLEALSYGTLIVSAIDRDEIVERFGTCVGEVMGDGTDETSIRTFADAIEYWMMHDSERRAVAQKAIEYVRGRHSIAAFTSAMRAEIFKNIR